MRNDFQMLGEQVEWLIPEKNMKEMKGHKMKRKDVRSEFKDSHLSFVLHFIQ